MVHVAAGGAFSVRSVHLDATTKPRTERYLTILGIQDFVCSVHLDARPNHAGTLFKPFGHSRFRA
ncbi:hypothetical protein [uncultured Aggregatibacter sp.]|uniref:hypothetical protein n=1 Tax=uncultured Aggregatibacter sp. TaxID=470564 RepID=UPI0025D26D73|nr:hypothetical protein [uncultured Aggregatibacter sp.]